MSSFVCLIGKGEADSLQSSQCLRIKSLNETFRANEIETKVRVMKV